MRMFCFDLDDTLVSERSYVESGLRAAGRRLDAIAGAVGSGEWLVAEWRRTRGRDVLQRRVASVGADPGCVAELVQAYREHHPEQLALREGAREVLEAIVARGDRLSIVSDGNLGEQHRKWSALGLALPFVPVVFTDERGRERWKPHPWGFEAVMAAAPAAAGFVYVGDNAEKDFIAPNRLGWTTVELRHPDNLRASAAAEGDARPRLRAAGFAELLRLT